MTVIKYRRLFYIFSGLVVGTAIAFIFVFGLKPGIDFAGGSIVEIEFRNAPQDKDLEQMKAELVLAGFSEARLQPSGQQSVIIRARALSESEHQLVLKNFGEKNIAGGVSREIRFDSVGPVIGAELKRNAFVAIALVNILILAFISWAFRAASRQKVVFGDAEKNVAGWEYAVMAVLALIHDVLVPTGFFAFLGRVKGVEIDSLFVTALLTVLGFSVHDTIVVFDRVRENLSKSGREDNFEKVVGKSLNETYGRSVATSVAVLIVLAAIFWFGADSTRYFVLILLVGLVAGTYSSIFLASPFLVSWRKFRAKTKT